MPTGKRLRSIPDYTDSTTGIADGTLEAVAGSGADAAINNNFAELAEKFNALLTRLREAGWLDR